MKIAGFQVLGPADSVEDAIALCQMTRPDLALIDLNLRDGGDGVKVAYYLHQRHQTPCLFLSAQAGHARANRHLAWGLVRKPYDSASVPEIINFIARLRRGDETTQVPAGLELFRPKDN